MIGESISTRTTNSLKTLLACAVMAGACGAGLAFPAGAGASVLFFPRTDANGDDAIIQGDLVSGGSDDLIHTYGSAAGAGVSGFNTPDVAVEWGTASTPSTGDRWFTLGGGIFNDGMAFYAPPGTGQGTLPSSAVTFTAADGYEVLLNAISAKYFGDDTQSVTIRVNVDGVITDFTEPVVGGTMSVIDLSSAGSGSVVTLRYQAVSDGFVGNWGFDNLTFSQIPEPASLTLVGLGGAALLRRRR